MLQNIRDKAQGWLAWVIVVLISIPFALWGIQRYVNPKSKLVIAEVNGVELSQVEFKNKVRQQERRLKAMWKDFDISMMEKQIKQSTLEQMIEQELLVQSAAEAGFRISDAMLAEQIHSIEAFQQEGRFSQGLYEVLLENQGMSPALFEMEKRRDMLVDQMRQGFIRSSLLTAHDESEQARFEKQQRHLTYLVIPSNRFDKSVTVEEAEIEKYFKENPEKYMTPEKVSINYVELKQEVLVSEQAVDEDLLQQYYQEHIDSFTTPPEWHARHILLKIKPDSTPDDIETTKKKAEDLLAKIRAGESFEELAKTYSEDVGSAEKGGDLGWFGEGIMVESFELALSTLKVDEISEPVRTKFGFHLIQLMETKPKKTQEFAEIREQLEKDFQQEQAETEFYSVLDEFGNLAYENSDNLDVLSNTLNLEKKSSELFDRSGTKQTEDPVLSHPEVIKAAFSNQVLNEGYNSEGIEITDKHVVVLRVKEHVPAKPKLLADVKDSIIATLKKEKTKKEVETLGKTVLEEIKQGKNPNEVVKAYKLKWLPAQWIGRRDNKLGNIEIAREVFKFGRPEKGKAIYRGMTLNNGNYAIVALLEVKDGEIKADVQQADSPENPDPREQAKEQQQIALGETVFSQFVSSLKSKAEIINYPENLE